MAKPRCPTCQALIEAPTDARPFCSARCKLVDLGSWLSGDYRVPALEDPFDPSDLPDEV
jgi:endogenous inhibitor of DNA gyrase (YacG/DUF329 family)